MHLLEGLRAVVPMRLVDRLGVRQAGSLEGGVDDLPGGHLEARMRRAEPPGEAAKDLVVAAAVRQRLDHRLGHLQVGVAAGDIDVVVIQEGRSEEHTSELQSLMRISYAVFCLKKKK